MAQKVKPMRRQELEKLLVTDADAFTALRYLRHRDQIPAIPELEEKGTTQLPGIEGSLCDLYHVLWSPEPEVKEDVPADRRYWQNMLGEAMKTSSYDELHASTQLKELQSVLGTIAMGESVLAMVPKEDQEKLQELQESSADAKAMADEATKADAEAQAAEQLANAASEAAGQSQQSTGEPTGQPSGSKGQMTSEQAKQLASELSKQAEKAKADAKAARQLAEEATAKAEQLAEELMGKPNTPEAQKKSEELRRMGMAAMKAARAKVEEVSETIEAWGLEEGELTRKGIPETLGVLERMKRNASLKKFAALLGRIRKIAARKAKSKQAGEGARITIIESGRDLKRAVPSELVALTHPALRVKALMRWQHGELQLFGQKTKQKLGYGPVVVCEDGSGSMAGDKQLWAKAVTLSLAHYAKLQKRSFGWIHFGAQSTKLVDRVYPQGQVSPEQMLEIAETFRNASGTDFEKPLRRAIEMIRKEGLKKADICFITDGECAVSDKFLQELRVAKKALEINIFTVLCDVGSTSDATIREFSDRIETVSNFTAEEAESKLFRHM